MFAFMHAYMYVCNVVVQYMNEKNILLSVCKLSMLTIFYYVCVYVSFAIKK